MKEVINKILTLVFIFNFVSVSLFGQVLPDGTTLTFIDKSAQNNVPVVNIAAPSAKGVSHNKFAEYNVGPENLILNNNKQDGANSKLGGYVAGNPNLIKAQKEASIILNEVTSNKKTNLNGYTEILGSSAELIIANPNGINIAGAGFINTAALTIVTGTANLNNGSVSGFNISQKGKIAVSGINRGDTQNLGLSVEGGSPLYLSSRYITSAGGIYAEEINILTGNNGFNYETKTTDSITVPSQDSQFALDAADLGGMYAGRINIIGTEKGFGVRTKGGLVADLSNINISNTGSVEYADLKAEKEINITAQEAVKGKEAYAKGDININSADLEYDSLKSAQNINITAAKINHTGTTQSGGNINITAEELNISKVTDEDLLLSYNDINLNIASLNNNGGEIAAYNDININPSVLNNSGLILANNKLKIEGGSLNNNANGAIWAKSGILIATDGGVLNTLGSISSEGDIVVKGLLGAKAAELTNKGGLVESSKGSLTVNAETINNLSVDNCNPASEICYSTRWEVVGVEPHDTGKPVIWRREYADSLMEADFQGRLLAKDSLNLNGSSVTNNSSIISSEKEVNINADNFYNTRSKFEVKLLEHIWEKYKYKTGSKLSYRYEIRNSFWYTPYTTLVSSLTPAVLSAPTVNITAANAVYNDYYTEQQLSLPWATSPVNQKIEDAKQSGILDPIALIDFGPGGMFKHASPDSKYLYVTNNRFLNLHDFIGSDYFLDKMGLKSDKDSAKWLGDAAYEQKLIEETILKLTGSRYLYSGMDSMNGQMVKLYDNSFNAYIDLGLEIGKPLTAEQIALLPDNIIWYVEKELDGQKVLVPTLYLSNNNRDKFLSTTDGGIIQGDNININAGDINNSGAINGGVVQLYARGDIKNISGVIRADEWLEADAGGNIINETKKNTILGKINNINRPQSIASALPGGVLAQDDTLSLSQKTVSQTDYLSRTASITGGDLNLKSGKDIIVKAGHIGAQKDLKLSSQGDISITGQELTQGLWVKNYENYSQTNVGSFLESKGNISLDAVQNASIAGSALRTAAVDEKGNILWSGGDINITGQSVSILSEVDTKHYYYYAEQSHGLGGKKVQEDKYDASLNVGSDILSGGSLNIKAQEDITVLASSLTSADGDMLLDAGQNINILAGVNEESKLTRREKSNLGGLNASKDTIYDEVKTLEAASAFSGKNISLKSGGDTTVLASDIGAAGDGNIETGGNFNLLAGIESQYHYEYHMTKSFDPVGMLSDIAEQIAKKVVAMASPINPLQAIVLDELGILDANNETKQLMETGRLELFDVSFASKSEDIIEDYQESARASTLSFGGDLSVNADKTAQIKGSDISTAGGLEIVADDISVSAQELNSWNKETHKKTDFSLNAGISNSYVNTAIAAKDAYDAGKALEQANKDLEDAKKDPRIKDLGPYQDNVAIAAANLAIATYAAYNAIASGTTSAPLAGFQADAGVKATISEQNFQSNLISNFGSSIYSGGDAYFTAANDINQKGSYVQSDSDITYKAGGDIVIEAAKNIYKETSSSSSKSVSAGGSTAGTVNLGYSQQKTSGQVLSIEWQNSAVVGKGVNIESGADTTFKGANVQGEKLNIKTGGELLVESLQNTYYSNSTSTGFNAGISVGLFKPLGSGSAEGDKASQGDSESEQSADKKSNKNKSFTPSYGENKSKSTRDSMWVNNQTTLIGADSVNIDAQSTHIKGGVIANIDENGVDKGNLSLNTGSLTYEDIFDYDHSQNTSSSWSSSLPINYGSANFKDIIGRNTEEGKEQDINPKGKTTISQARKGHELEQSTHATVGQGAITIDGQEATEEQLDGLNRDTEAAQEITKDEITGGLNYNLTIDHEVAAKVSVALAKTVVAVAEQGVKLTGGLVDAIGGALSGISSKEVGAASNKHASGNEYQRTVTATDAQGNTISLSVTITFDEEGNPIVNYAYAEQYGMPKSKQEGNAVADENLEPAQLVQCLEKCAYIPIENGELSAGKTSFENINNSISGNMPESIKDMFNQALSEADEFLAKNWNNSEVRTGLLGVQEAWHSSVLGQTADGTFVVIGENTGLAFDSIAWGGLQLGKQLGLAPNINTDYELNIFTNSSSELYSNTIGSLPYERQQDLGLISEGGFFLGGATVLGKGVSGVLGATSTKSLRSGAGKTLSLQTKEASNIKHIVQDSFASTKNHINPYQGVQDASKYLQDVGVSRADRVNILQSFNPQNMSINIAGDSTYGLRFYNAASDAAGRYLFPTFTNQTTRSGMAILPEWNNMTGIQQFQIKPGSIYLQGTAAPQGIYYPGGSQQVFTPTQNLIKP